MLEALLNIGLAFIEGFALIISPCILPILPIILSGSLTGKRARPIGIIVGFVLTFVLVTLFSRTLITLTHLSSDILRNISFVILVLLSFIMMSTFLTEKFTLFTQRLTSVGSELSVSNNRDDLLGGCLFGALVGIIWTPCAGPILAAVLVQVIIQKTTIYSFLTLCAFAVGAGVPMLLIAFFGRKVMQQFRFFKEHAEGMRKLLGAIILLSVVYIVLGTSAVMSLETSNQSSTSTNTLTNGLAVPYKAPDIAGIDAWLNSSPLQIQTLQGKVVLIDFWTYSCINCLRTLPYLKAWYAKYHDRGFEIIGVHAPEFAFESEEENVKNAVMKLGILYPVALDNHFITWRNYHNQYWPAHYLINKEGEVVYTHFGEGDYEITENNIRYLLGLSPGASTHSAETIASGTTPETYLGYARAQSFASVNQIIKNQSSIYQYPETLLIHQWALSGAWTILTDKIVSGASGAAIKLHFNAAKVFAVMGAVSPVTVRVLNNNSGVVTSSEIKVTDHKLYTLMTGEIEDGELELIVDQVGLEIYTFTFG